MSPEKHMNPKNTDQDSDSDKKSFLILKKWFISWKNRISKNRKKEKQRYYGQLQSFVGSKSTNNDRNSQEYESMRENERCTEKK